MLNSFYGEKVFPRRTRQIHDGWRKTSRVIARTLSRHLAKVTTSASSATAFHVSRTRHDWLQEPGKKARERAVGLNPGEFARRRFRYSARMIS